jgi:hypothetical protein
VSLETALSTTIWRVVIAASTSQASDSAKKKGVPGMRLTTAIAISPLGRKKKVLTGTESARRAPPSEKSGPTLDPNHVKSCFERDRILAQSGPGTTFKFRLDLCCEQSGSAGGACHGAPLPRRPQAIAGSCW